MQNFSVTWLLAMASYAHAGAQVPSVPYSDPAVAAASNIIIKSGLQSLCSSILGYTAPTSTVTSTTTVTPTSIYVDIIYATTYYTTDSYTRTTTAYSTNALQRRRLTSTAAGPLKTFAPNIITSACELAAPRVTVTATVTSTAPEITSTVSPTDLQSLVSYVPIATATTTVGIDCGVISQESRTGVGGRLNADGIYESGLYNCTTSAFEDYTILQSLYIYSVSYGYRADGIRYCELYQKRKAKQVIAETTAKGPDLFTYFDTECFLTKSTTTAAIVAPTSTI